MVMPLTFLEATLACVVVAFGAALHGACGFGMALIAAPVLLLIDPRLVPAPLICASLPLLLLVTYREWGAIDILDLAWLLVGRVPATMFAAATLALLSERWIVPLIGLLLLVAVALSSSGLHLRPTRRALVIAGLLSGFMGTVASLGGPPVALVYQREAGARLRGTLSGYFIFGAVLSLVALRFAGRFGLEAARLGLIIAPGAVVGFLISSYVSPLLDRGYTRVAVLAVSTFGGLMVILQQVL